MKDLLKDFIDSNRSEFDYKEPSDKVWNKIDTALPKAKHYFLWNSLVVWRTAAALLLGVSVYLFFTRSPLNDRSAANLQRDFTDQELFYSDQIAEKVALIDNFDNAYEDDQFTQDFQKLEAMYQVLREEMKSRPSEKVRDALILNMLVRIDLLNQQIKRLEDTDKKQRSRKSST